MAKPVLPDGRNKPNGLRLPIILGIAILACVALRSALSLAMLLVTSVRGGMHWRGDFWSDAFPIIVLVAITGIGSFGIYKLVQVLRR